MESEWNKRICIYAAVNSNPMASVDENKKKRKHEYVNMIWAHSIVHGPVHLFIIFGNIRQEFVVVYQKAMLIIIIIIIIVKIIRIVSSKSKKDQQWGNKLNVELLLFIFI